MVDAAPSTQTTSSPSTEDVLKQPAVVLVIGMAGSGKTTFMQRLNSHLHEHNHPSYVINLDPAVTNLPYSPNIDIRDTVNYKNVMEEYNLGPNGAILTSLNLFATQFGQVVQLCNKPREQGQPPLDYIITDTPGQIEIFTWSASGTIVTEGFASQFPTMIAYIVDTPRCAAPQTFMTNMLQACSILYKSRLPVVLVFNKVDVCRHEFAMEWMSSYEAFAEAVEKDATYAASLSRSMSLVLEEFYTSMKAVGVSSITGEGFGDFLKAVEDSKVDYMEFYRKELEANEKKRQEQEQQRQQTDLEKLQNDLKNSTVS